MIGSLDNAAKSSTNARKSFSFCVLGLSARNEILLKAMVRLLRDATLQEWVYAASGRDLVVLGFGDPKMPAVKNDLLRRPGADARARLWVGGGSEGERFWVALPLHFKDMEAALNRVGAWLMAQQDNQKAAEPFIAPVVDSGVLDNSSGELFRLLRWPPSELLPDTQRKKAATILLKTPSDLATLARRSGMHLDECTRFVNSLPNLQRSRRAAGSPQGKSIYAPAESSIDIGLLSQRSSGQVAAPAPKARHLGILARIRSRLGLAS